MPEYLTMEEIKKRYPDEWVLLEDPETDEWTEVIGGTLLSHSAKKSETLARFRISKPGHWALLFTGEPDPEVAYLL